MLRSPLDDSLQYRVSSRHERVLSSPTSLKTVRLGGKGWLRTLGRPRIALLGKFQGRRIRSNGCLQLELSPPSLPFGVAYQALLLAFVFVRRLLRLRLRLYLGLYLCLVLPPLLQPLRELIYSSIGIQLCPPCRGCEEPISSRNDAFLKHPLPPFRVRVELGCLHSYHGSGGVHGIRVDDLLRASTFTQVTPALAFLIERVLASRAVYDPGQVFQCYMYPER